MSSVNDFSFKMGTVNGTGSASANGLLMQAIFRMGIPVTGKNIFPSNIQGLPTWYEIRVSKDGYTARPARWIWWWRSTPPRTPRTWPRCARRLPALRLVVAARAGSRPRRASPSSVPFGQMCVENFEGTAIARCSATSRTRGRSRRCSTSTWMSWRHARGEVRQEAASLLDANHKAIRLGYDYAKANFACPLPFHLEKMDATSDRS
jgi:2-oxoglutarate/2-oxoacid ferredoxin oxidoreductase subunit alpha